MNVLQFTEQLKDKFIILLIGVLVGTGAGTGLGYFRVDKFTGTQGSELDKRLTDLEKTVYQLPPDWLKERIAEHSVKINHIELEIERIQKDHVWFWNDFGERYKEQ